MGWLNKRLMGTQLNIPRRTLDMQFPSNRSTGRGEPLNRTSLSSCGYCFKNQNRCETESVEQDMPLRVSAPGNLLKYFDA